MNLTGRQEYCKQVFGKYVMRNVKAAVCIKCGVEFEAGNETYVCTKCGGVLEIVYDYDYIKKQIDREKLSGRR